MRKNLALQIVAFIGICLLAGLPATGQLTSTVPFSLAENGGIVLTPTPSFMINVGYVTVQTTPESPALAMTEILGFRSGNTLISETVIPASPPASSGRMYMRLTGPVLTGAAFANPNSQPVTVVYYFTDQSGIDSGPGFFVISANSQYAWFFNQAPFSGAPSSGTFTYNSTAPISVMGLRSLVNERGDFLLTPIPATRLPFVSTEAVIIDQWADGMGYSDRVVLINTTDTTISGNVQFLLQTGTAATVTVNGSPGTLFPYSISRRASLELVTSGVTLQTGSVRITPGNNTNSPAALSIISYKPSATTVSEAVIVAAPRGAASRMYVEHGVNILNGVSVANPAATLVDATFTLTSLAGIELGSTMQSIPGNGRVARFLSELFPSLPSTIQGILRVSTPAVMGLVTGGLRARTNERSDLLLSGVPAALETGPGDSVHPHIMVGGGYESQLVVFSRAPGPTNSGTIRFISATGEEMPIIDVTAPTVSMTSPANSAIVSGTIDVTANSTDNVGVAGVQFLLDGSTLGAEDTIAPYTTSWNTAGAADGSHSLAAVSRDAAGNRTTAGAVTVTVNNISTKKVRPQLTSQ